jgi:hypothetical protein
MEFPPVQDGIMANEIDGANITRMNQGSVS